MMNSRWRSSFITAISIVLQRQHSICVKCIWNLRILKWKLCWNWWLALVSLFLSCRKGKYLHIKKNYHCNWMSVVLDWRTLLYCSFYSCKSFSWFKFLSAFKFIIYFCIHLHVMVETLIWQNLKFCTIENPVGYNPITTRSCRN